MSNSLRNLVVLVGTMSSAVIVLSGCAERVADCVEVYQGTGATRRPGYTMTACVDHCKQVQGAIDCYWDGDVTIVQGGSGNTMKGRTPPEAAIRVSSVGR